MTVIDPNTGLTIACQPWEYTELCKQRGWIKTVYKTNATPIQKRSFTLPEEAREKILGNIHENPELLEDNQ